MVALLFVVPAVLRPGLGLAAITLWAAGWGLGRPPLPAAALGAVGGALAGVLAVLLGEPSAYLPGGALLGLVGGALAGWATPLETPAESVKGIDLLWLYLLWQGLAEVILFAVYLALGHVKQWQGSLPIFLTPLLLGLVTFGYLRRQGLLAGFLRRNYHWARWRQDLMAGGITGVTFLVVSALAVQVLGHIIPVTTNNPFLLQPRLRQWPPGIGMVLAGAVFFAPVAEEAFFRGLLYRVLRDRWRPTTAMVISGVLFGAAHLNPGLLLPLSLGGVLLAFVYERTGSLIASGVGHAFLNLTATLVSLLGSH